MMPTSVLAAITVVGEPGADPVQLRNVQQVVDAFNGILAKEMNVTLERDVKIFVSSSRANYAVLLQREIGQTKEAAEKNAQLSGGFSGGRAHSIVLNSDGSQMKSLGGTAFLTGHELFHQVQGQLEGEKRFRLYWMSEGTADLMGALVADRLGVMNLAGWKKQRINSLRKTPNHASPQELSDISLSGWTSLMEKKMAPYEMSDFMVMFLFEQAKEKGTASIADYFRQSGRLQNGKTALSIVFGIGLEDLVSRFSPWFEALMAQTGNVEVEGVGSVNPEWVNDVRKGVDEATALLEGKWGIPLQSALRVLVVGSSDEYVKALTRELGYAPDEAAKLSQDWGRYSRGSAVLQSSMPKSAISRSQSAADLVARMWVTEAAPQAQLDKVAWLRNGGAMVLGYQVADRLQSGALKKQQDVWLGRLTENVPRLAELVDLLSYQAVVKRVGAEKVNAVAALATLRLIEKYGEAAYGSWVKETKAVGDGKVAFSKVYGRSLEDYAAEFDAWLVKAPRESSSLGYMTYVSVGALALAVGAGGFYYSRRKKSAAVAPPVYAYQQIPTITLRGIAGPYENQTFAVQLPVTLGRDAAVCNVAFAADDLRVSRTHASIAYDAAQQSLILRDHSSNGTFLLVNGQPYRIVACPLQPGNMFCLGDTSICFEYC